jgi:hypothetical protein
MVSFTFKSGQKADAIAFLESSKYHFSGIVGWRRIFGEPSGAHDARINP